MICSMKILTILRSRLRLQNRILPSHQKTNSSAQKVDTTKGCLAVQTFSPGILKFQIKNLQKCSLTHEPQSLDLKSKGKGHQSLRQSLIRPNTSRQWSNLRSTTTKFSCSFIICTRTWSSTNFILPQMERGLPRYSLNGSFLRLLLLKSSSTSTSPTNFPKTLVLNRPRTNF